MKTFFFLAYLNKLFFKLICYIKEMKMHAWKKKYQFCMNHNVFLIWRFQGLFSFQNSFQEIKICWCDSNWHNCPENCTLLIYAWSIYYYDCEKLSCQTRMLPWDGWLHVHSFLKSDSTYLSCSLVVMLTANIWNNSSLCKSVRHILFCKQVYIC